MLDDRKTVDLTAHDLDMIEQALQTQKKILAVESRAGGSTARARLNELKGLLRRLDQQRPEDGAAKGMTLGQMARAFFGGHSCAT